MALFLSGITASAQQVLSLQQVKEQALAHNISISTAEDAVREAREQKKRGFYQLLSTDKCHRYGF